ncbi:MAG TPA: hypothetical protein VFR96_05010 [Povalibacter sp.]|jgi:hypothetical protein|nr:hypothetical protein [Povalibacter sp.]
MSTFNGSLLRVVLITASLSLLAACAKQPNAELQWARAALQRNPTLELIAVDEATGMFTVRDKHSGEVHAVALQDLAAAPISQLNTPPPAPMAAAPAAMAAPEPAATVPSPEPAATTAGVVREEEPASESAATSPSSNDKGYTIERTDGRLKISGPGISVVSAGAASATPPRSQTQASSEPIICEGKRMLQLDNRQLRVEGNAITVRGGCELYLTNSNIVATGVGVVVHDGTVHIANSYVEGGAGSFEADSQARVFVRGSTFQGLSRRDQLAEVQDQGGNRWR